MQVHPGERDQNSGRNASDIQASPGSEPPFFMEGGIGRRFRIPDNSREYFPEVDSDSDDTQDNQRDDEIEHSDFIQASSFSLPVRIFPRGPSEDFSKDIGVFGNAAHEDNWNPQAE